MSPTARPGLSAPLHWGGDVTRHGTRKWPRLPSRAQALGWGLGRLGGEVWRRRQVQAQGGSRSLQGSGFGWVGRCLLSCLASVTCFLGA